jgi:Putative zinc-finger
MNNRTTHQTNPAPECGYDLPDMMAYINGTMPQDAAQSFEKHMAGCPDCCDTVRELASVTPDQTREFFEEAVISESSGEPIPPFPRELTNKIRLEKIGKWLRNLAEITRCDLPRIVNDLFPLTQPQPAFSTVRSSGSGQGMLQMDIINLSAVPVDDNRLKPSVKRETWRLSGCPTGFQNCVAYIVVIPLDDLRRRLPGWNRDDSQEMLTRWFQDKDNPADLRRVVAVPGMFSPRSDDSGDSDNLELAFTVLPDVNRLIHAVDRMAAAIIFLDK